MKITIFILCSLLIVVSTFAQKKQPAPVISASKKAVIDDIQNQSSKLIDISDKIWAAEETAFNEIQSSKLLSDYAEANGFKVERGVADMPTAFVATYGSGSPVIGILGEFDALPGLSQNKVPTKSPLHDGKPGHGCGHNLFGTASLGAAVAIKDMIAQGKLKGTIKFYGTPAEEKFFGKLWMVRAGLFDGVDVVMDWHPGAETRAATRPHDLAWRSWTLWWNLTGRQHTRLQIPGTEGVPVTHWNFTRPASTTSVSISSQRYEYTTTSRMEARL
jgi:aminobenzoyl-glutamate utilization protein B